MCHHIVISCCCFTLVLLAFASGSEVYDGVFTPDSLPRATVKPNGEQPDCSHHLHRFYRQMNCQPQLLPGQTQACPTSYKCATLEGRSPDLCYYGGRSYPVGHNLTSQQADLHTPCIQSCQCVRMYEGARFYCSQRPKETCTSPPGCRHFGFMEDFTCCQRGVTSCNQGKPDSVKCVYGGRSYSEGERFFPSDDVTCTQCICASGFNGTLSAPYCRQFSCALELWGDTPIMLTRGCIPVYLSESGCCPVFFRCPKPTDKIINRVTPTQNPKLDAHCRFGNLTLPVGAQLSPMVGSHAKEVVCSCQVPPLASCVRRHFVLDEETRRQFAREGLEANHL